MSARPLVKTGVLVPLVSVCILATACLLAVFLPDTLFAGRVRRAAPMMDQLNQQTLEQIPPPVGATLFESSKSGNLTGQGFGRWLDLTYNKNSLTRSNIYQYYLAILASPEWKIDSGVGSGTSDIFAEKGSSCVKIRIFDDSVSKQYDVSIWQDLKKFVGAIPENDMVFQLSDTAVAHCP